MRCAVCRYETKVIDSRPHGDGTQIRRRRECLKEECRHRFTTVENAVGTFTEVDLRRALKAAGVAQLQIGTAIHFLESAANGLRE